MAAAASASLSAAHRALAALAPARAAAAAVAQPAFRAFSASAAASSSEPFDRPGPVPLPPKEQREFEKLVREKANSLQFNSTNITKNAAAAASGAEEESLHPDVRRKPKPDFEGDTNPVTGAPRRPSVYLLSNASAPASLSLRAFSTTRASRNGGGGDDKAKKGGKDQPPSKSSDPFPLPFDPALTSSSIEGSPPPALASTTQLDGLPAFVFEGEGDEGGAGNSREVYSPMTRVPGRTPLTEDREVTIARLVYQVRKRGTLETDLLLSTFAKTELKKLTDDELLEFDRLLDEPDWDIFYWSTDRKPVPERWAASFATPGRLGWRLRKHTKNEEKVPRRMPNLE
ncbi:Succinate dehydrogenase assembly factor 2 mitochondrial [Tilletia horrida]|uniref:Succinate dehydrogenase assembly factor 2, mitochondrial n=1 Tax=Tilletia horrida TaxID=155126 RepID=A0AAN6GDU7_9BASI|nr:Succinate dehydrogenase assembly factor 2 mitochondrial [Tilletia horrida]